MRDVTIVPLKNEHLAQVESWASGQSAAKALLKLPVPSLSPTSDTFGWAAMDDGQVLAIATITLNKEHIGYLECRVKPSDGRQGIGSQIVEYVLSQPEVKTLIHLRAAIEMSNISAQKTLDEQGFFRRGYTADGRIEFSRPRPRTET